MREKPSLFHLRVPFPFTAAKAEIVHNGVVLWSKSVSANAPTVNITAPNGGTYNAANPVTIMWTASDPDGAVTRVRFFAGTTLLNSRPTG